MGIIEEILKNKEELLVKLLMFLEGKEAKTKINLDGIGFKVGETTVSLQGDVELTFVPKKK